MSDTPHQLEESIVRTLELPDLEDAVGGLAEVELDSLIKDSPLRDIPIITSVVGLARTWGAVRDYIFTKKIARFLLAYVRIPIRDRASFLAELQDPQRRRQVGETLLVLLDRLDSLEKARLLGILFSGMVGGKYDLSMFRRLAGALDRLSLPLFPILERFYGHMLPEPGEVNSNSEELQEISSSGLVGIEFGGGWGGGQGHFTHTQLGRLFLLTLESRTG